MIAGGSRDHPGTVDTVLLSSSPTFTNHIPVTKIPTDTLLPSETPSPSATSTFTNTFTPTGTPTPTPTPTPLTCWSDGGYITTGALKTELLRLPLEYRIYLPPCYEEEAERRYPVLILFHGQSYSDDQWDRLGVDEKADSLIADGEIPPIIVVMPRDRYGGEPGESNFGEAILEVLIPFLDETYRTIPERSFRAVGGLSRGAGWSVHLGITYWEYFGALGAHSPAIFHYDAERMRSLLDSIPPDKFPRIYMDIGDRDRPEIMRVALWFEDRLNERSIPHEWHLFSGYHAESYWSAHLENYLRWYAMGW